jgi:hypothetical protein
MRLVVDLSPSPGGRLKVGNSGEHLGAGYVRLAQITCETIERIVLSIPAQVDMSVILPSSLPVEILSERIGSADRLQISPYRVYDLFLMLQKHFMSATSLAALIDPKILRFDTLTALSSATWLLDLDLEMSSSFDFGKSETKNWTQQQFDSLLDSILHTTGSDRSLEDLRASPDQLAGVLRLVVAGFANRLPTKESDNGG